MGDGPTVGEERNQGIHAKYRALTTILRTGRFGMQQRLRIELRNTRPGSESVKPLVNLSGDIIVEAEVKAVVCRR